MRVLHLSMDEWSLFDDFDAATDVTYSCYGRRQTGVSSRLVVTASGSSGCLWSAVAINWPYTVSEPYGDGVGNLAFEVEATRDSLSDPSVSATMTAIGLEIVPFDDETGYRYGIWLDQDGSGQPIIRARRRVYPGTPTGWDGADEAIGGFAARLRITRTAGSHNTILYQYSTDGGVNWTTHLSQSGAGGADMHIETVSVSTMTRRSPNNTDITAVYSAGYIRGATF